jgi:dTDP-4-amino-4,6-dideoxygalactose transaminase
MELGSEFNLRLEDLHKVDHSIIDYLQNFHTIYFDSGRSALRMLTETMEYGEVLLPEYICDSVLQCFSAHRVRFYRLNERLEIDIEDLSSKVNDYTVAVYVMHYFGSLQPRPSLSALTKLKNQNDFIIIEDTTHSIFSNPQTVGDYCICSLRKWLAIPDGGILYSGRLPHRITSMVPERNHDVNKSYAMILKTLFLDGKIESNTLHRKIFAESEERLDGRVEVRQISFLSELLLLCNNVQKLIQSRKENFMRIHQELSKSGLFPFVDISPKDHCPFTYPIKIGERDRLRQYLIERKIYCAVHWPLENSLLRYNNIARQLSSEIISLPIDQRYSHQEMNYMIQAICEYERTYHDSGHSPH